jgi:hypothetical protein
MKRKSEVVRAYEEFSAMQQKYCRDLHVRNSKAKQLRSRMQDLTDRSCNPDISQKRYFELQEHLTKLQNDYVEEGTPSCLLSELAIIRVQIEHIVHLSKGFSVEQQQASANVIREVTDICRRVTLLQLSDAELKEPLAKACDELESFRQACYGEASLKQTADRDLELPRRQKWLDKLVAVVSDTVGEIEAAFILADRSTTRFFRVLIQSYREIEASLVLLTDAEADVCQKIDSENALLDLWQSRKQMALEKTFTQLANDCDKAIGRHTSNARNLEGSLPEIRGRINIVTTDAQFIEQVIERLYILDILLFISHEKTERTALLEILRAMQQYISATDKPGATRKAVQARLDQLESRSFSVFRRVVEQKPDQETLRRAAIAVERMQAEPFLAKRLENGSPRTQYVQSFVEKLKAYQE